MNDFFRVLSYVKPYTPNVVLAFLFNILYSVFSVFTLGMIVPFISILFGVVDAVELKPAFSLSVDGIMGIMSYYITLIRSSYGVFYALLFVSALFLGCSFISNLCRFLGLYFMNPIQINTVRDIQNALYRKSLILPLSYYSEHKSGDVITRLHADVQELDILIRNSMLLLLREPWLVIVFLITLLMISPFLTLVSLSIFPLLTFILTKISVSIRRKSKQGQAQLSILGSMFEESISGLRIIKGFNAIDYFIQKFKVVNQSYTRLINKVNRKVELASPLSEVLCTLSLCFVIGIGGYLLFTQKGHLRADTLILFVLVFARLIPPLQAGVRSFNLMQKALVSARRVFELMDADEVVEEKMNALPIKHFEHNITFKDVSFAYESSKGVLHHINLTIEKGQSLALVGMSGAGKTTLLNLLPRFYDVSQGEILLDGVNIKDYVISDLRALMGLVSQDILLFNDTVYNNICFGLENVSEKQVYEAAKIANADEFISAMPQGYQTNIGDRGVKLSGGQRQRLSIARAVLRNPEILLFDEATSALDSQSEVMVQEAIENVMRNRTSVMIAHRLTSVQNADRILVFQEGNVVEEGSHHQLIQQNGMYAKWVEMQQVNG
mgnify:FL=1